MENNSSGKTVSLIIGAWFIVKWVLNLILGGFDIVGLLIAAVIFVLCFLGIKYTNYVIAGIAVIVVLVNLIPNIRGILSTEIIRHLIYLAEGAVDIICAAILCLSVSVKEHFSNGFSSNGY